MHGDCDEHLNGPAVSGGVDWIAEQVMADLLRQGYCPLLHMTTTVVAKAAGRRNECRGYLLILLITAAVPPPSTSSSA
jgi:hypothetical protein